MWFKKVTEHRQRKIRNDCKRHVLKPHQHFSFTVCACLPACLPAFILVHTLYSKFRFILEGVELMFPSFMLRILSHF